MSRARTTPRKKTRRPAGRKSGGQRPGSADLLALVVLGVTAALAACNTGNKGGDPVSTDAPRGEITVRFLDVGQGDAVLIRSPEGKTLLVDGGRSAERMQAHMQTFGIEKIDLMVATHADADHIAGLVPAAKAARPTLFISNGLGGTTQTWQRLVSALEGAGTNFQKANNQVINLGSVKVRVVKPPADMADDQNENSVGLRVDFGDFHALMTGDSETAETRGWLAENRAEVRGPVQVYKSIHHGAANGDNAAWLATVRPENVVISVGENSYGHPTASALQLYKSQGARVYRTDRQGTVTFTGKADGTYSVTTDR